MQRRTRCFLSILLWAFILCIIPILNLNSAVIAINLKTFALPAVFGGILGFFLFKWHERDKDSKYRLTHLNSVLLSIRNINRILSHEKDSGILIQEICDTLVKNHSYYGAWIALSDANGKWSLFAEAGLGANFKTIIDTLQKGKSLTCCKRVLSQQEIVITDAPPTLCGDCPLASGYESGGAISAKLQYNGKIYGMITLSVPATLLFDPEQKQLANELSTEIAFGLHAIELGKQLKDSEKAANKNLLNLKERMKELHCLYNLSEIMARRNQTTADIMKRAVNLIPPAFQHPKASCARIKMIGNTYQTDNFEETDWKFEKDIVVNQEPVGILTVCYLNGKIKYNRDPFPSEEKALVNAIAERLGKTVERSQAQMDLQESEKGFRILIENSLTGISIVQGNEVVYQNKEQERLLGPLPRSYIMGEYEKVHPNDAPKVKRFSKDIMKGGTASMDVDFRYSPEKGTDKPIWIYCRASGIVYHNQVSILFNMMDMTRTKELEKLLIAQDKMASLGRVAAGIAHEIRNPLSGINIYLNTLEKFFDRGESEEKVKNVFRHMESASKKIESVIYRVMDFSKPGELHFILADVNAPIEEALKLTSTTLRKSGVLLEKTLMQNLPKCHIDFQQFEEVILNIINNAADAMRGVSGEKRIKIISGQQERHIVVRVLDSGPGIALENREKIFDPFFTTKPDSTGIGLSICHRIISDHNGEVKVQTSKWGGTEFRILIPITKPAG